MIIEYQRPQTLQTALELLARPTPKTIPLGGGTVISRGSHENVAVVDLQALKLDAITLAEDSLVVGAAAALQSLCDHPAVPDSLKEVIKLETGANLRNMATVAGSLVTGDGRSPLATALLALDAHLIWEPGEEEISLENWLEQPQRAPSGKLITHLYIPRDAGLKYAGIGRTPKDRPILCVAFACWPSGRVRVAIGGCGNAPVLALDGTGGPAVEPAVMEACSQIDDQWASAAYRSAAARVLARRLSSNNLE